MLPKHMEPESLRQALLDLDSQLQIEIGYQPINPALVDFCVLWNHHHGALQDFLHLKTICVYGHGVDNVISDPKLPEGVPVVRLVDETMAAWMSEYLLTVVLMKRRHMLTHILRPESIPWGKTIRHPGNKVGILGIGYLGQKAAGIFQMNGFEVFGWSRTPKSIPQIKCFNGEDGLRAILRASDFLICLLPLTTATENLLCYDRFMKMKPGSYLINVGRGKQVVDADLIRVLNEGHLSGACLDVFRKEPLAKDHPFRKNEKILLTPHNSSSTPADSVAPQILENFRRMKSQSPLLNKVNVQHGY